MKKIGLITLFSILSIVSKAQIIEITSLQCIKQTAWGCDDLYILINDETLIWSECIEEGETYYINQKFNFEGSFDIGGYWSGLISYNRFIQSPKIVSSSTINSVGIIDIYRNDPSSYWYEDDYSPRNDGSKIGDYVLTYKIHKNNSTKVMSSNDVFLKIDNSCTTLCCGVNVCQTSDCLNGDGWYSCRAKIYSCQNSSCSRYKYDCKDSPKGYTNKCKYWCRYCNRYPEKCDLCGEKGTYETDAK